MVDLPKCPVCNRLPGVHPCFHGGGPNTKVYSLTISCGSWKRQHGHTLEACATARTARLAKERATKIWKRIAKGNAHA